MKLDRVRRFLPLGLVVILAAALSSAWTHPNEPEMRARNRYIGVKGCKGCHNAPAKGNQVAVWEKTKHAKAFETLASDKAKAIAAKMGIKDPQKDDKCLVCHVTAFGTKKKQRKRSFKFEMGVQCEACHGPGEKHMKGRFKASSAGKIDPNKPTPPPAGEIIQKPPLKRCLECHNKKSPTFKPFCFKMRNLKIFHPDPRKKRTKEQLDAMKCKCGDKCKCEQGECGSYETDKPTSQPKK